MEAHDFRTWSAEIIKLKTRYVREVDEIKFELEYFSGVLPTYHDADDT